MCKQKTDPFERIPRNVSVRMRRVFIVVITEKGLKELRAQQAANRAKQHKGVEEEMASLNTYLATYGPEDLQHPAILTDFGFRGEFHDGNPEAHLVVQLDNSSFNKALPQYAAQLLLLHWEWRNGHPSDEHRRRTFECTFPIAELRALLAR